VSAIAKILGWLGGERHSSTVSQPHGLISVLCDVSAPVGDRDDAAMDLAAFDEALPVLISVARRADEDEMIVDQCAHSIGVIWQRTGGFDQEVFNSLPKLAQDLIRAFGLKKTNA
jgi:hypothetical protein